MHMIRGELLHKNVRIAIGEKKKTHKNNKKQLPSNLKVRNMQWRIRR
jgi:hypothetical protein